MSDLGNKAIMAENIKYYMDLNNKSRNDMCEALGFKYSTFTDWVNGKKYPRIDKIEMIANYFGIEKSDLVEKRDKSLPEGAIPYVPEPMVNVPLVGSVNCGTPLFAEDNIEGYIPTPESDLQTGETYFWLRAKGDSMINAGIHHGDLLLIRQSLLKLHQPPLKLPVRPLLKHCHSPYNLQHTILLQLLLQLQSAPSNLTGLLPLRH